MLNMWRHVCVLGLGFGEIFTVPESHAYEKLTESFVQTGASVSM